MSDEQLTLPGVSRARGVRGIIVPPQWLACLVPHPLMARVKCQRALYHKGNHIKYRTGTAEPEHAWTTTT